MENGGTKNIERLEEVEAPRPLARLSLALLQLPFSFTAIGHGHSFDRGHSVPSCVTDDAYLVRHIALLV